MSNENEVVQEGVPGGDIVAEALKTGSAGLGNRNILDLPVRIVVSVGAAQLTVQNLLELKQETVIDLEAMIDDPVEIYVGEKLIARGELVEATDNENGIGVRLIEICGLSA